MGWMPLLKYTFENHAAVDETGNRNFGSVELPGPDCWVDAPTTGIATTIRYDNTRSKIVIADRPSFAGWPGFRVNVIFQPGNYNRRINLVEGDGSFAFFVEANGSLQGTIFDGKHWYGVSTAPGIIISGNWYIGEFLYDPSSMLILRLNGVVMDIVVTHGDPVRAVGPNGIMIGYWPGGDDRYTFIGLIGPISIDTLDPANTLLAILGKLVCNSTGRLEAFLPVVEKEFTVAEQQQSELFAQTLIDTVKHLTASVVGTAKDQTATLSQLRQVSQQLTYLTIQNEEAGTNLFNDPAFTPLLARAYNLITTASPNTESVLLSGVLNLLAVQPLTPQRLLEIMNLHPELCFDGPGSSGSPPFGSGNPIIGIINKICELCCIYCGEGRSSGGSKGGGTCGVPGSTDPVGTGGDGKQCKQCCEFHFHLHHDQLKQEGER